MKGDGRPPPAPPRTRAPQALETQLSDPTTPAATEDAADRDPLAQAAHEVGDRWSLLIVDAAAKGVSRFDDFHRDLNVARNILSSRLRRLVELDILHKRPVREGARRMEYALTDKGLALETTLSSMRAWAVEWAIETGAEALGE